MELNTSSWVVSGKCWPTRRPAPPGTRCALLAETQTVQFQKHIAQSHAYQDDTQDWMVHVKSPVENHKTPVPLAHLLLFSKLPLPLREMLAEKKTCHRKKRKARPTHETMQVSYTIDMIHTYFILCLLVMICVVAQLCRGCD